MSDAITSPAKRTKRWMHDAAWVVGVALVAALCASALDLAVSLRTHPGALAEPKALAQLFLVEVGMVLAWGLALIAGARAAASLSRHEGARVGALLAAAIALVVVVPLSTLLGIERIGAGLKPKLYLLSLFAAGLWLAIPCAWLAARVKRPSRALLAVALLVPVLAASSALGVMWKRAFPTRNLVRASVTPKGPKHIVLITVDTLRPDYLSAYEPKAKPTRHIDALASDATLYEHAESLAPWTKPSLSTLQTGLSPTAHHVTQRFDKLDAHFDTLAERLLAAGYHTGVIAFNPFLDSSSQLDQGFMQYDTFPRGNLGTSLGAQTAAAYWLPVRQDPQSTPAMTERAQEWLREHAREPFFFWLHYYDPHQPYEPPERLMPKGEPPSPELRTFAQFKETRGGYLQLGAKERAWIRELYAGEVQQADEEVGKVIAELKSLGIYDDALIVFTSDHGEEFWEHGGFEHGHSLYEELLHVPLLIKLPHGERQGRVRERVSMAAVYPTVLDVAGLPAQGPDKLPRLPSLRAGASDRDVAFLGQGLLYYEDKISVLQNDRKYIHSLVTGKDELYDLSRDPGEQSPLSQEGGATEPLRAALRSARSADGAKNDVLSGESLTTKRQAASGEMLRNLRSLGYVQ